MWQGCVPVAAVTGRSRLRSADDRMLYVQRTQDCHSWATGIFLVWPVILEFSSSCDARPRHLTAALQTVAEDLFV